ncbi:MAG TPA: malto-oligosyltrehalose trehalohydrolase [Chryseosolibacter sp.]|nr:malto-oligosyltrehalose trehalohydrolase [Chryseosolibacter sp.]
MNNPRVGAVWEQDKCSFTVWAPFRKQVEIVLEAGGGRHMLSPVDQGYWTTNLYDIQPGAGYFFLLDGEKKLPDPASRAQLSGVHGASTIIPENFEWSDHEWKGRTLGEMVIYELHVGTFSASHDFDGVIARLPYLHSLGINALELMPVAQFPGERNWGYDGVFPFAVQSSYGGAEGLKKLVNKAHLAGIAVILDVVYNHQGPEGNYLADYGPYFTDKYRTGWGQAMNFDDAWCDGVRHYYWQNALMWLDEFHIDGLRLDAVHAIWDFSARHFIEELATKVKQLEKTSGRRKVLIAEFDLNNPRYISPAEKGGYALDGQWVDEFHHAVHSLITGETDGYYEDFGEASHLAKSLKDGYVYTGQFSRHRKKHFGKDPLGINYDQFVVFVQNHDQVGNRMLGDRLSTMLSRDGLKLIAATCLLSPFVPMLFMGEEYGEKNPFQYFISHTDEKLVDLVRKGRKQEFSYFQWQGDVPDPQAEDTFEKCVLSWDIEKKPEAQLLFSFYQYLINFRKSRPAMQGRTRDTLNVLSFDQRLICFERKFQGDHLLILLNFNKQTVSYALPSGRYKPKKIFDSDSTQWGGISHPVLVDFNEVGSVDLLAETAVIFEL